MAYTPNNNPYIPGDPYSYDLKWIICQLKRHSSELSTLDERILKAVMQSLDQHDPIYFETADEMINSGIRTGALAYIEGYHAAGDGGENLYYTTSDYNDVLNSHYYITLDGANRWAIPIIMAPWITPQMFGAYGDGEHDDTDALNTTFDNAFNYRRNVYIPNGDYNHTGVTIYGAGFAGDNFTPTIRGASRLTTRLIHTGAGVAVDVLPRGGASYVDGLNFSDLFVVGNANTTHCIRFSTGTRYNVSEISVSNASVAGYMGNGNIWISTFRNLYAGECATGFSFRASNTSITLDECYVMNSTVNAYDLQGNYMRIGVLAADFATGENVYKFEGFQGSVSVLGAETCAVTHHLRAVNSFFTVNALNIWNPDLEIANNMIYSYNSNVVVDTITLSKATAETSEKPIALVTQGVLKIGAIRGGALIMAPPRCETGSNNAIAEYQGVNTRLYPTTEGRQYVGFDRSISVPNILTDGYKSGAAIFTNCKESPRYLADGTDLRWSTRTKEGDWFIENLPNTYYAAAYVVLADNATDAAAIKQGFIPVIASGTTAERPSPASIRTGAIYFDTTLGKPIFRKNASTWVDATGATV